MLLTGFLQLGRVVGTPTNVIDLAISDLKIRDRTVAYEIDLPERYLVQKGGT